MRIRVSNGRGEDDWKDLGPSEDTRAVHLGGAAIETGPGNGTGYSGMGRLKGVPKQPKKKP